MDDYVSGRTVEQALAVLRDRGLAEEMTEHNYQVARKFFSYEVLRQRLTALFVDCFGC